MLTSIWDPVTDQLVWIADTRTTCPVGPKDLGKSISGAVVPALTEAHLVLPVRGS